MKVLLANKKTMWIEFHGNRRGNEISPALIGNSSYFYL